MSKKKLPKAVPVERPSYFSDLSPHAKQAIVAVAVAIMGVFFAASLFELGGPVGHYMYIALDALFGSGAYLSPLVCGFYVYALLNPKDDNHVSGSKILGIALLFLALLGMLEHYAAGLGGFAGLVLLWPLETLLGGILAGTILGGLMLISVFLIFNTGLHLPRKSDTLAADDESDIENLAIPDGDFEEILAESARAKQKSHLVSEVKIRPILWSQHFRAPTHHRLCPSSKKIPGSRKPVTSRLMRISSNALSRSLVSMLRWMRSRLVLPLHGTH
jgi:hypothetical protein